MATASSCWLRSKFCVVQQNSYMKATCRHLLKPPLRYASTTWCHENTSWYQQTSSAHYCLMKEIKPNGIKYTTEALRSSNFIFSEWFWERNYPANTAMSDYCLASIADAGPTLSQHLLNVSCFLYRLSMHGTAHHQPRRLCYFLHSYLGCYVAIKSSMQHN